jgi:3-methylcrotonyl-CoA carboxylase beta subunit
LTRIESRIDSTAKEFYRNRRLMLDRIEQMAKEEDAIRQGGGARYIKSQHKKNRLTARERIARLIDPQSDFFEQGIYAAYQMYEDWG